MNKNTTPNAFSPGYTSQISPFKPRPFKVPRLEQPNHNIRANIAPSEEGKRARLLKANI